VDLAAAQIGCGDPQAAERSCRRALVLDSRHLQAHFNLGTALYRRRAYEAAASSLREALALDPDFFPARVNLGLALRALGEFSAARAELERARELFERALASEPGYAHARVEYAYTLLAAGDYARGWEHYEARWEANGWSDPADFRQPLWKGEPLEGRSLLVWGEQGVGDQILFAGLLPEVIGRAAACTVTCEEKLVRLFSRSFPGVRVLARNAALHARLGREPFDFQTPIGSLARFLRRAPGDFPLHSGYLRADPQRVCFWRERLAALGPGRTVGLSWRGGVATTRRHFRSIPLESWLPLLRLEGVHFVSLQYTDCVQELETLRARHGVLVHHWPEAIADYDETAALVCALDSVASVCTALVHLAGALGRPALVLVPAVAEWRYGRTGPRMPWYPSVELVRQRRLGDWAPAIEEVAARLRA
jgi:tetratricopeptide (TPR) repeat protein